VEAGHREGGVVVKVIGFQIVCDKCGDNLWAIPGRIGEYRHMRRPDWMEPCIEALKTFRVRIPVEIEEIHEDIPKPSGGGAAAADR
jgi:hypothetical protein